MKHIHKQHVGNMAMFDYTTDPFEIMNYVNHHEDIKCQPHESETNSL